MAMLPTIVEVNGQEIEFPGDMHPDDISAVLRKQFPNPKTQEGFFEDMRKRGARFADIQAMQDTGEQGMGSSALQRAGNIAGTVGDVAGTALGVAMKPVSAAYGLLPEKAQERVTNVVKGVAESVPAQMVGKLAAGYEENLAAYNKANPEAGRNYQAVRELGNFLPLGAAPVRKVASKGIDTGAEAFKSVTAKKIPELTSAERKIYAGALYDEADVVGGALKPEARKVFRNELSKYADEGGERLTSEKSVFDDMLEVTKTNEDKPLTLKTFKTYDQKLTELIHKERSIGGMSPQGRKLMELQDTLRDMVDSPNPDLVIGGEKGFSALRNATKEYKLSKQQEEIEGIIEYANKLDNPATSLKAQMRVLSNNKKRMAGYSPEARKLINQAAKDGAFADFLRTTAGSRLIGGLIGGMAGAGGGAALGGGVGAIPGAIGGIITGAASRGAAKAMKTGQIKKIEKAITSQSAAGNIPREFYKLPPEEAKAAIRKYLQEQGK